MIDRVCFTWLCLILFSLISHDGAPVASAQEEGDESIRFEYWELSVDSAETALAAWQIEVVDPEGRTEFLAFEGGSHSAFSKPPKYVAKELVRGKLILAAFSTAKDLPRKKTVVAGLHVQVRGDGDPMYRVRIVAAAGADGNELEASVTLKKRTNG
ncbi:MAG: hypothetical protein AAF517_24590 [Planctomycetota bacterium]